MSAPADHDLIWQITELPRRRDGNDPHVAYLRRCDSAVVRIEMDARLTDEDALLTVQQLVGILTPFGLRNMMQPLNSRRRVAAR